MKFFLKKIPRGIIYHQLCESFIFLIKSIFWFLDKKDVVKKFEERFANYIGCKFCVSFPFARTAIYFSIKNLNLPPGAKILMPPITIKGILDVVVELGLEPIYVDLDIETANFNLEILEKTITSDVKVAIVTPLFGLVPDLLRITDLLRKNGVFIIEDFSQCLNGAYNNKKVGTFGDLGVYSSSSIKTLDTLGGGQAVTNNKEIFDALIENQKILSKPNRTFLIKKAWINLLRNLATSQPYFSLITYPFLQFVRIVNPVKSLKQTGHRNKSQIASLPSVWFTRYTSLQAQIGLQRIEKVKLLDSQRIKNVEYIKSNCIKNVFPKTTPKSSNVYWQFICPVENALVAQVKFAHYGIDLATSSLELISDLKSYPGQSNLPKAKEIYQNAVFIPCSPGQSGRDLTRIVIALNCYFHEEAQQ